MTPAIVVIETPDQANGGTLAVRLPLWRPAYTPSQARYHFNSDALIVGCLDSAAVAHAAGNPAAPLVAARVLRARPDLPWPLWLVSGVIDMLERGPITQAAGRHANPWGRWRDDAADYLRYRAVELLAGAHVPRVYAAAVERLRGEGGEHASDVTTRAVQKAYERVIERCGKPAAPDIIHYHPRYFPDVASLHALHAADVAL